MQLMANIENFSSLINPIRLWGSTYNYQFETYFPKELILLSFLPLLVAAMGLLLRPHDRRVLFCSFAYLFVFIPYQVYINLHYLVFNLPYGSIFEAPSIFLVPASLGLALLIGFTNQTISGAFTRFNNTIHKDVVRYASLCHYFDSNNLIRYSMVDRSDFRNSNSRSSNETESIPNAL